MSSCRATNAKLQLAARYSVLKGANGAVFVERYPTTAKVYPEVVLTSMVLDDWRGKYVINHFTGVAPKMEGPHVGHRDISKHERAA